MHPSQQTPQREHCSCHAVRSSARVSLVTDEGMEPGGTCPVGARFPWDMHTPRIWRGRRVWGPKTPLHPRRCAPWVSDPQVVAVLFCCLFFLKNLTSFIYLLLHCFIGYVIMYVFVFKVGVTPALPQQCPRATPSGGSRS